MAQLLVGMGYDEADAEAAVQATGSLERAIDLLTQQTPIAEQSEVMPPPPVPREVFVTDADRLAADTERLAAASAAFGAAPPAARGPVSVLEQALGQFSQWTEPAPVSSEGAPDATVSDDAPASNSPDAADPPHETHLYGVRSAFLLPLQEGAGTMQQKQQEPAAETTSAESSDGEWDDLLAELQEMGFDGPFAKEAAKEADGDVKRAVKIMVTRERAAAANKLATDNKAASDW